jgi:hypothetical protein
MKSIIQKWGITFFILLLSLHLYGQILGEKFRETEKYCKMFAVK